MVRGIGVLTAILLSTGAMNVAAFAAPLGQEAAPLSSEQSCTEISLPFAEAAHGDLAEAAEFMTDICRDRTAYDDAMLIRATRALSDWAGAADPGAADPGAAEGPRDRFYRALAALEAHAELHAASNEAEPAVMPRQIEPPSAEDAIFVLEEAAAPFLGPASAAGSQVLIAVDAPDYQDLFTVYFPRGSAHMSLPAQDMVALAAEAVRGIEGVEIWVSAGEATYGRLALDRVGLVEAVLLQNDVPGVSIHLDDGSLHAILNRPARLAPDTEL